MKYLKTFENFKLPKYEIGDYVEIFYIDDDYIFKIDDVRFEEGYDPLYVCTAINYSDIYDNIYEAEENEISEFGKTIEELKLKLDSKKYNL
jgi:hypothetical protein